MTESVFFQDLAVMMFIAGLAAAIFSRLGWPKVFGYLLVGILMNGHTWGGAFLADPTSITTLGQLGIVFLMLTMGLEFSTSDMRRIRSVTFPTAILDTAVMVWLGYVVGSKVLGWKPIPSLFLGAAICDSATTLLAKMIGDLGWSRRPFVKYVLGTSVCEDILCVGLIALVTGVAQGSGMSLGAVGLSLGGLLLFFLATIVFGLILVPRLLTSVGRKSDDEALLLTLLGICFLISWVAYRREYSLAIGAFLVGILGASSEVKRRLLRLVAPLRSMFAAMFFVSIGLLVDPQACLANLPTILLLSATVVLGKGLNCLLGGLLTGQSLKTSVQMSLSLAQIGEFAFMVALLYVGVSRDPTSPMFQVTVGVSLLTTLANPFLIRLSDPLGDWLEARCPRTIRRSLETYRAFLDKYRASTTADDARRRVRRAVVELAMIAILALAVAVTMSLLDRIDWSRFSVFFERHDQYIFLLLINLFFLTLAAPIVKITGQLVTALNEILVGPGEARWQPPVRGLVKLVVFVVVISAFLLEGLMLDAVVAPNHRSVEWGLLVTVVAVGIVGWRFFKRASVRAKERFDEALKVDERLADLGAMITIQIPEDDLNRFTVTEDSPLVGGTVVSLDIRARTGVAVVSVEREGILTHNVGPSWVFAPGDSLVVIGEPEQLLAFRQLFAG